MSRFFLSGQTTCALLLGAGLLLRAQAALRPEPEQQATAQSAETPGTRNSDMVQELHRTVQIIRPVAPAPKVVRVYELPQARIEKMISQSGNTVVPKTSHSKRTCKVASSGRGFRCG